MVPELIFIALIGAHFFLDFAGQGDFLAKAKNHTAPIPGVPWDLALVAHATQHGAAVALITGSPLFGLAEALIHAATDYAKCQGLIDFREDQSIHIYCKIVWFLLTVTHL